MPIPSASPLEHAEALQNGLVDIGEAARLSGVSAKMVRHYEETGLLKKVGRSLGNYRLYSQQHIHTLRFIRRSRALGFSMEEIRTLLSLWEDQQRSSASVKQIAADHIARLETRIHELQGMVDALKHLTHCCSGDARPECPILDDLAGRSRPPHNPA